MRESEVNEDNATSTTSRRDTREFREDEACDKRTQVRKQRIIGRSPGDISFSVERSFVAKPHPTGIHADLGVHAVERALSSLTSLSAQMPRSAPP